jgi:hypothetical protein
VVRADGNGDRTHILLEVRGAEGNSARLPELAADLVRRKVDLIVTRGSLFTGAAKAATLSTRPERR